MEAMAMARPVLSTFIAGIPELVRHGENGWLIPAGNSEALRTTLVEVCLASTEQLNRLGLAGRERVGRRHDLETEVSKLEALMRGASRVD
jgi:glycosyltransferase involved in cell wall biosynthesis